MQFPNLNKWTFPFPVQGLLGGNFRFYSKFERQFCRQTVETLIRRSVLLRLIWVCTICTCPTKRTLGLYGFEHILVHVHVVLFFDFDNLSDWDVR